MIIHECHWLYCMLMLLSGSVVSAVYTAVATACLIGCKCSSPKDSYYSDCRVHRASQFDPPALKGRHRAPMQFQRLARCSSHGGTQVCLHAAALLMLYVCMQVHQSMRTCTHLLAQRDGHCLVPWTQSAGPLPAGSSQPFGAHRPPGRARH